MLPDKWIVRTSLDNSVSYPFDTKDFYTFNEIKSIADGIYGFDMIDQSYKNASMFVITEIHSLRMDRIIKPAFNCIRVNNDGSAMTLLDYKKAVNEDLIAKEIDDAIAESQKTWVDKSEESLQNLDTKDIIASVCKEILNEAEKSENTFNYDISDWSEEPAICISTLEKIIEKHIGVKL